VLEEAQMHACNRLYHHNTIVLERKCLFSSLMIGSEFLIEGRFLASAWNDKIQS
jgi:hypothetical protein